jgi:hypothetical protein
LEDIYEDDELSELEGEELEKSVQLSIMQKWEHWMIQWMEAYRN